MSGEADETQACEECGATIYPEMIAKQAADRWDGRLLCPHCLREKKPLEEEPAVPVAVGDGPTVEEVPPLVGLSPEMEDDRPDRPSRVIKTFGGGGITFDRAAVGEDRLRRALIPDASGATRCRTFHAKLNDASMAHINAQINEWADSRDDIVIKFATSNIGVVEGKHADPHLIVTVFY